MALGIAPGKRGGSIPEFQVIALVYAVQVTAQAGGAG